MSLWEGKMQAGKKQSFVGLLFAIINIILLYVIMCFYLRGFDDDY